MLNDWCRSSFHTLITDESKDISVSKMLIIYVQFRKAEETCYYTMFAGILKLTECSSRAMVAAITQSYQENNLDLGNMVIFTGLLSCLENIMASLQYFDDLFHICLSSTV